MTHLAPRVQRKNFYHLVQNTLWMGLASAATARFASVYAIRIGATPLELGLLAALPAIFTMIAATGAGWWIRRYTTSAEAMRWPSFGLRLGFPMLFIAPFLPLDWQPIWVIISLIVPAVPAGVQGVIFIMMLREAVNTKFLTPLFSRRQMAWNIGIAISTLGFGLWLERAAFPINYQVMYLVATGLAVVGWRHLNSVQTLPAVPAIASATQVARRHVWDSTGFRTVALVAVAIHIGWFAIAPILPLWLVREFEAGEGFIALYGMAELVCASLISLFTSKIVAHIGSGNMIALGMLGATGSAGILAFAPAAEVTLLAAALGGASWTAAAIGLFGFFSERTTSEARTTIVYTQIIALATFFGPLIGSGLANVGIHLGVVLLGGALLRFIATAVTWGCVHYPINPFPALQIARTRH
jgi:MFS family permease